MCEVSISPSDLISKINSFINQLDENTCWCGFMKSDVPLIEQKAIDIVSQLLAKLGAGESVREFLENNQTISGIYYYVYILLSRWWCNLKIYVNNEGKYEKVYIPDLELNPSKRNIYYHLTIFDDGHLEYLTKCDDFYTGNSDDDSHDSDDDHIKAFFNRCESSDEFTSFIDYLLQNQPSLILKLLDPHSQFLNGADTRIPVHNFYMSQLDILFEKNGKELSVRYV